MHFCDKCDNMFYIKLNEDAGDSMVYYCKNCGNENLTLSQDNICVSSVNYREPDQNFNHIVNEYTKLDPTLPKVHNIMCPNDDCICNVGKDDGNKVEPSIIYIRYDDTNKKFMYMCTMCEKVWKTDEK
jgi:DNA-directed RNA polymerase subunit M/transcription elongation factor TFIIS